jgi:hypothetical protein
MWPISGFNKWRNSKQQNTTAVENQARQGCMLPLLGFHYCKVRKPITRLGRKATAGKAERFTPKLHKKDGH